MKKYFPFYLKYKNVLISLRFICLTFVLLTGLINIIVSGGCGGSPSLPSNTSGQMSGNKSGGDSESSGDNNIINTEPVANAGPDQKVIAGSLVTLDGKDSYDADEDTLTYKWMVTSIPSDSSASIDDSTSATPSFVPDVVGSYVLNLVVNDGELESSADFITITAISLTFISISPTNPSINVGATQQFIVIGTYSDNTTQNLTSSAIWSSSDTSIVTISNDTGNNGLATSVAAGSPTITATYGGKSATTILMVTVTYKVYGISFSPYMDGQDPNMGSQISEDQLYSRMSIIAPYTHWLRTFGSTHGLEEAGSIAHELSLKAAIGAWLSDDLSANEQEISNLISAAKAGDVDIAIVGSEVLLRNDLTESQLIEYIDRVKEEAPDVLVTTADVYGELLAFPDIMDACDIIFVNYYPFWEGINIEQAIAAIDGWHKQITDAAGDKTVIVSETGWPSDGYQIGNAVPSDKNASYYFLNFVSWARANDVSFFYFEAFDERWKAAYEGEQGAHWGIWNKDGILKSGMQDVFDGKTMMDNWSSASIPGGPGTPSIEFTSVPPYGSYNNLKGQVWHVNPNDYKIAIYIYVSGWWTKPYFGSPSTAIKSDGSWECDITTGGTDQNATKIATYLVPESYSPPAASGSPSLPSDLDSNAVAKVETTRSP